MSCCTPVAGQKSCCGGPGDGPVNEAVSSFYASELSKIKSKKPTVCAYTPHESGAATEAFQHARSKIHPDLQSMTFGCGTPFPPLLKKCNVVDLGSGPGLDVFIVSYLVGPEGHSTGVDMTKQMIESASGYLEWHKNAFGYSNVDFKLAKLEDLANAGLSKNFYDVIVSNCVINLVTDKKAVLAAAYDLLKPGGEMYFSDVYTDRSIPEHLMKHELAYNACFSGALPWDYFVTMTREIGFQGPFVTSSHDYPLEPEELKKVLEGYKFWSKTVRLVKAPDEVGSGEGTVTYKGDIEHYEKKFIWDTDFIFKANTPMSVPKVVARAIANSRYTDHFEVS